MDSKAKILMLKGEKGDPGGAEWGNISGSLSSQTDLKTELDKKANSEDIGPAALTNDYNDLNNKPSIPSKTSDLTNDSGFVVDTSLATVATSGSYTDLTNKPTQLTDFSGVLPVNQGGTGATDGAIPRRFTLFSSFEGVEPTTLTLSDSIQNYQKIGVATSAIVWDEHEYDYGEFIVMPGVTTQRYSARVLRIGELNATVEIHLMEMDFSGTTVTYIAGRKGDIDNNKTEVNDGKFKIHYIYGYKY